MCSVSLFQFLSYWFFVCENRPAEALVRSWVSLSHGRARLYHDIWWWVLVVPSNNQRVIVSCLIPLNRITADQGWIPPGLPAAVSTIYIYIYREWKREMRLLYIYICRVLAIYFCQNSTDCHSNSTASTRFVTMLLSWYSEWLSFYLRTRKSLRWPPIFHA